MAESEMGDIVLRLIEDEVMPAELRIFLTKIQKSKKLRANCASLGTLVDPNIEEKARKELMVALITFLLYEIDPLTHPPGSPYPNDKHWPRRGMAQLMSLLHEKDTKWDNHTLRVKDKPKPVDRNQCYLTDELWTLVAALEDLWGLQGVYVNREPVDVMKDQLRRRGAISGK